MENLLSKMTLDSLEAVQNALAAPFPENELKKRQQWSFIPVERVRQRLIQVVGVDAFDIDYSPVIHHEEDWLTVDCTLTIDFSKWGGRIKSVTQSDGIQIKRHTKEPNQGLIVDLGNDYKSVKSGALTKAAADFGVGLYLQLEKESNTDNSYGNNNNYSNNNNRRNNGASENQKNAANRMEKAINIPEQTKSKLLDNLFPNGEDKKFIQNPTFSQMDKYLKVLKPVADIVRISRNAKYNQQELLKLLSEHFKRNITSFTGLLTLANEETVNFVENLVKNQRRSA